MFVNAISEKDKRLIAEGRKEGRKEGRAEAEAEALRKAAQQMKADGMPLDVIRKYTGLTQEELQIL